MTLGARIEVLEATIAPIVAERERQADRQAWTARDPAWGYLCRTGGEGT